MSDSNHKETFERHAQTVIQLVITALLIWIAISIVELGKSVARLETKSLQTDKDIMRLETESNIMKLQTATAAAVAATAALTATTVAAQARPQR